MKLPNFSRSLLALSASLILWTAPVTQAQTTAPTLFHVTIDTSQLVNHPAGAFALQCTLVDGSGNGDGNSTVMLTNFNFGTNGFYNGDPDEDGGTTGDMSTNVTLTDTSAQNDFTEPFTVGNTLTFDVYTTLSLDTNGVPDDFEIAIVDSEEQRLPTVDTNEADALIRLSTTNGVTVNVEAYGTDPSVDPFASPPAVDFGPEVLLAGTTLSGTPALTINANSDGSATVAWPAAYTSFVLEETPDLVNWTNVPNETVISGTNLTMQVFPANAPCEFYRLVQ